MKLVISFAEMVDLKLVSVQTFFSLPRFLPLNPYVLLWDSVNFSLSQSARIPKEPLKSRKAFAQLY